MSLIGEIWKEAFEVFESAPQVFIERKEEIDQGAYNLILAVDRLHGASEEQHSIGSQVVQLAQEYVPGVSTAESEALQPTPFEQPTAGVVQDAASEARNKIDAIFDDIYQQQPDLQYFDDELTSA